MDIRLLQDAIDFYSQGNSMAMTAKQFHSTPGTLKKLFRAKNIHIRSQHEQCILENIKRTKGINHQYFQKLTQENAYYLGFFAADATVRKNRNEIKIGLSSVDKDFLEGIRKNMNIEKTIHIYQTSKGFECAELSFSSLQIKLDLSKYGIVPNKTFKGINLNLIPDEFKLAFIKGFFDGDGSISFNKNTKQGKVTFTSYTKDILNEIQDYFNIKGNIYTDKRRSQLYSLEFSTLPSLNILKLFYNLNTPYLPRKKEKYDEWIKIRK